MFHHWLRATDGSGASVRTALLDFRKAFDLVDHIILVGKLHTLGVKPTAINWIIDFLKDRKQRVKLMFLRVFPRGHVLALGYSWC